MLSEDKHNKSCLHIVDNALFVICLDDFAPDSLADLCSNYLCGTYNLQGGEQVGTCTNRWYDKVISFDLGVLAGRDIEIIPVAPNHRVCRWLCRNKL